MNPIAPAVLITGAAGALGRAVAAAFESAGWSLALLDVQMEPLQQIYGETRDRRVLLAADLFDTAAVERAVHSATERLGSLRALCNIAGGFAMGPAVHETSAPDWQRMQDLNAGTLLNAVRAVTPLMLQAGAGRIVNVASLAGLKAGAQMGAYSAAKSSVIRITEAMSAELRARGINVNCVLPSIIDTAANRAAMPDADASLWVAPDDLARVILFLCSDDARAVHGAAIPVTGLS